MCLFCFAVTLGFLVAPHTWYGEKKLHNVVNKRVQFAYIKLVTLTIWSDTLLPKMQSTRRVQLGNL